MVVGMGRKETGVGCFIMGGYIWAILMGIKWLPVKLLAKSISI